MFIKYQNETLKGFYPILVLIYKGIRYLNLTCRNMKAPEMPFHDVRNVIWRGIASKSEMWNSNEAVLCI